MGVSFGDLRRLVSAFQRWLREGLAQMLRFPERLHCDPRASSGPGRSSSELQGTDAVSVAIRGCTVIMVYEELEQGAPTENLTL